MRNFILIMMIAMLAGCGWFDAKPAAKAKLSAPMMAPPSEWFPSLVPPTNFGVDERTQVLSACGVTYASVIWVQYVDLDMDRCNDAIVTISLPPATVDNGKKWMTVTYVFHGKNEGSFSQQFHPNDIWFSLVTDVATSAGGHQTQTRRQFALRRTAQGIFLTLNDCLYESTAAGAAANGSSGSGGALQFRESITDTVNLEKLSPGIPLPLELAKTSSTQTRPVE